MASSCLSVPFTFLSCAASVSFPQDLTGDEDEDRDGEVGGSSGSGTPVMHQLFWETKISSKTPAVSPLLLSLGSLHRSQTSIENEAKVIQQVFLPHLWCLNL